MPTLIEHSPASLADILNLVEVFQNGRETSWYRGVGNSSYGLIPALVRRSGPASAEELRSLEQAIAIRFAQRSPPFIDVRFDNEWRSLFYMQHYGIPTRLLDWSESPFVGLYFALTSVKRDKRGRAGRAAASGGLLYRSIRKGIRGKP